jgi:hypothetical protein
MFTILKDTLNVNNDYDSCLTSISNANTILKQHYALQTFIMNLSISS